MDLPCKKPAFESNIKSHSRGFEQSPTEADQSRGIVLVPIWRFSERLEMVGRAISQSSLERVLTSGSPSRHGCLPSRGDIDLQMPRISQRCARCPTDESYREQRGSRAP